MYYQHDGAPPHATLNVRHHLNVTFRNRWIGRYGHVLWPPRSPDLTPLDFFLWGDMKNHVYSVEIESIEQLRARILEAAALAREKLLRLSIEAEARRRLFYCIREDGRHFEQFL